MYHKRSFHCGSSWYCFFWPGKAPRPKIVNNSSKRYQFLSKHLRLHRSLSISFATVIPALQLPIPSSFCNLPATHKSTTQKKITPMLCRFKKQDALPPYKWGKGPSGVGGHKIGIVCVAGQKGSEKGRLDVVRQPPDAVAVTLPHHHGAHEHLDGADALQWDLALARGLVHAQLVA